MKLLLVFTFLAFICLVRSASVGLLRDRELVLQDYNAEEALEGDTDDEINTTTTTTTRRSTYVFPTRNRNIVPSRRPWLTQPSTSVKTTTVYIDEIDVNNDNEDGFDFFKNIRKFFGKLVEDVKKFIRNITGGDLMKMIQRFFSGNTDD